AVPLGQKSSSPAILTAEANAGAVVLLLSGGVANCCSDGNRKVSAAARLQAGSQACVGWGATAEVRFVVSADSNAAAGTGTLVLETPLDRAHASGEPVGPVKASPIELRAFRRRRLLAFVQQTILEPIVAAAALRGEEVAVARHHQRRYERRPVPQYVFTARPVFHHRLCSPGNGGDSVEIDERAKGNRGSARNAATR
ncbi:unnamed protein product, partial [Phaeothamnion confervicola]